MEGSNTEHKIGESLEIFFVFLSCAKRFAVDLEITIVTLRFVDLEVSEIQKRTTSCLRSSNRQNH